MLLHIGEDIYLDRDEIILVLNQEVIDPSLSKTRLKGLGEARKISENKTRSILVTDSQIIESPIDSQTLYKRDQVLKFLQTTRDQEITNEQ